MQCLGCQNRLRGPLLQVSAVTTVGVVATWLAPESLRCKSNPTRFCVLRLLLRQHAAGTVVVQLRSSISIHCASSSLMILNALDTDVSCEIVTTIAASILFGSLLKAPNERSFFVWRPHIYCKPQACRERRSSSHKDLGRSRIADISTRVWRCRRCCCQSRLVMVPWCRMAAQRMVTWLPLPELVDQAAVHPGRFRRLTCQTLTAVC
mmetsp:Transcript_115235/g.229576  ORF Transcript_115235/g.229576 Transcript_115235/m.229576 type:complete len:207 (+) Transcript_115235:353-973(+)